MSRGISIGRSENGCEDEQDGDNAGQYSYQAAYATDQGLTLSRAHFGDEQARKTERKSYAEHAMEEKPSVVGILQELFVVVQVG